LEGLQAEDRALLETALLHWRREHEPQKKVLYRDIRDGKERSGRGKERGPGGLAPAGGGANGFGGVAVIRTQ